MASRRLGRQQNYSLVSNEDNANANANTNTNAPSDPELLNSTQGNGDTEGNFVTVIRPEPQSDGSSHPNSSNNNDEEQPRQDTVNSNTPESNESTTTVTTTVTVTTNNDNDDEEAVTDEENEKMEIIILDATQKKFPIKVKPNWTVQQLKKFGQSVHKCHPSKQRLICMGKLLNDDDTLEKSGIKQSGVIIHLFPKPNVVISSTDTNSDNEDGRNNNNTNPTSSTSATTTNNQDEENNEAHVPTVVLNAEEAERRQNMLIFTSDDAQETLNRARLLCFILALHCILELLLDIRWIELMRQIQQYINSDACNNTSDDDFDDDALPPGIGDGTMGLSGGSDGSISYYGSSTVNPDPCTYAHYFNFDAADDPGVVKTLSIIYVCSALINMFGIYVATIGFQVTSLHPVSSLPGQSLRQTKKYFALLLLVGTFWNGLKLFSLIYIGQETGSSGYTGHAIMAMLWPFFAWCFCYLRAWQLRRVMEEAESEARDRRNENDLDLV